MNRSSSCAGPKATCAAFSMCAGIAPALPPRGAVPERCFVADITAGPTDWTALINATEMDGVEDFRPEEFALVPVRVEEWFNRIFVNLDPNALSLSESLGALRSQAAKFPFLTTKLFERRTYDMRCN